MFKEDKNFYKKVLMLGIPISLQAFVDTMVNLVDTMMVGQLGKEAIAGVGLANKVFFVYILLVFGISSGAAILTAQYWGAKDISNIRRVLGLSLMISILGSFIFSFSAFFAPETLLRIFTPDIETIKVGAKYLKYSALTYPLVGITFTYVMALRGINKVRFTMIVAIVVVISKCILNYGLILGNLGLPELGVKGAAISAIIARGIELIAILLYVYIGRGVMAAKLSEMLDINKAFVKHYFITVGPVIGNEFMWGLGVTIYSLAYGRMSTDAVATITITQTIEQLAVVFFQGLANASGIALGNELGANKLEKTYNFGKNLIKISIIAAIFLSVVLMLLSNSIVSIFNVTQEVKESIILCLLMFAIYLPIKMVNMLIIVGILRSGGDTKACLLIDCTSVWLIGIPMAFLGALYLKQPIHIVYAMVMLEEVYKFILSFARFRKRIWVRNITIV